MVELSIITPTYNEEEVFPEFIKRLLAVMGKIKVPYEIIIVDDGSTDKTRTLIKKEASQNKNIKPVFFSRNFGHQAAVSAGLKYASGNAVVVLDSDLQDPPEVAEEMYDLFKKGNDVVYAVRKKRKEGALKRLCYYLYYRIAQFGSEHITLPLDAGDFSLMSQRVVKEINKMPERNRYVRGMRAFAGFEQIGLPYERDQRHAGESKYSAFKLFKLAYDGLFSFTRVPLMVVNIFAVVFSSLAVLGIAIVLFMRLATNLSIPGFASTAILILAMGGVQLFLLGIIGEYVKRISEEVKQRPVYIVEDTINFPEELSSKK